VARDKYGDSMIRCCKALEGKASLLRAVLRDEQRSYLWSFIAKKRLYEKVWFSPGYVIMEDYVVMPQVVSAAKEVGYVPTIAYYYNCSTDSLIGQRTVERFSARVAAASNRIEKWTGSEYFADAVVGALRAAYVAWAESILGSGDFKNVTYEARRLVASGLWRFVLDRGVSFKEKIKMIFAACGFDFPQRVSYSLKGSA